MKTCSVLVCEKPSRCRQLCATHYRRHLRGRPVDTPIQKYGLGFWAYVDRSGKCWLWRGFCGSDGYGRFSTSGTTTARAHRHAYELLVGVIPDDMTIDHLCNVRPCVNPQHMEIVTRGENTRRAHARRAAIRQGVAA